MSIQIRPGYTSPLIAMEQNKTNRDRNYPISQKSDDTSDKVTSLQNRQQQLQSEMLLIKAVGADTGQNTGEKLKDMEEKLKEVSNDLRTARADSRVSSPSLREQLLNGNYRTWRA